MFTPTTDQPRSTDAILAQIKRHQLIARDPRHDSHNRSMSRRVVRSLQREMGAPAANLIAVGCL